MYQKIRRLVARRAPKLVLKLKQLYFFGTRYFCPVCHSSVRAFLEAGRPPRPGARCPICGALERHRSTWLLFQRETNLLNATPKRMLHIAPEPAFTSHFKLLPQLTYLTADLYNPAAMVKMDITAIDYPPASFDVIYCSHVLEHVSDDRLAMREFYRVLSLTGWALIQVPITVAQTEEDPTITTPQERERRFGQEDHVRNYGPDVQTRLQEAGFLVHPLTLNIFTTAEERHRMGLQDDTPVFLCKK